jgi:3-oxoacyl-[acyl-carrier protein] reductase
MDLKLQEKVALVAGSSRGLGFGVAKALALEGAKIHLGARNEESLCQAAETIRSETGGGVSFSPLDASIGDSIAEWIAKGAAEWGGIDLLVANAGGPPAGAFEDFSDIQWQQAFEANLLGTVRMIRAAIPHLRSKGGGAVLTITSLTVKEPSEMLVLSNVMRSGVASLVKTLATRFAPEGIRFNNIMPGSIDTERVRSLTSIRAEREGISLEDFRAKSEKTIPLGRYGTIDEFGRAAAFLLSDASSYITGSSLALDGGALRTVW